MENNRNSHNQEESFWDFINSYDPNRAGAHGVGAGVDHATLPFGPGFFGPQAFESWGGGWSPFGPPWGGWGHRGHRHGRHGRRHRRDGHDTDGDDNAEERERSEAEGSPDTMRDAPEGPPGPPGPDDGHPHPPPPPHPPHFGGLHAPPPPPPPHGHGFHGCPRPGSHGPGPHRRRGGRCGRGGPRGFHGGPPGFHGGPPGFHGGPPGPPPPYGGPFDFRPLMHAFASHPFARALQESLAQAHQGPSEEQGADRERSGEQEDETFTPPVDIFNTEKTYVLHIALPGAVKEDVGVNWDPEQGVLNVAGVVYRPGDEAFLQSLSSSERKVGMFERSIKLPPPGTDEKDEVDGFSISAKMENGILIVTVPKAEKEWTEIHKIDVD